METENYRSDLLGHSGLSGSASGTDDLAQQALDVVSDLVAELKSREAHLRSILETVPDAMVIIDEVGLIGPLAPQPIDCSVLLPTRSEAAMSTL